MAKRPSIAQTLDASDWVADLDDPSVITVRIAKPIHHVLESEDSTLRQFKQLSPSDIDRLGQYPRDAAILVRDPNKKTEWWVFATDGHAAVFGRADVGIGESCKTKVAFIPQSVARCFAGVFSAKAYYDTKRLLWRVDKGGKTIIIARGLTHSIERTLNRRYSIDDPLTPKSVAAIGSYRLLELLLPAVHQLMPPGRWVWANNQFNGMNLGEVFSVRTHYKYMNVIQALGEDGPYGIDLIASNGSTYTYASPTADESFMGIMLNGPKACDPLDPECSQTDEVLRKLLLFEDFYLAYVAITRLCCDGEAVFGPIHTPGDLESSPPWILNPDAFVTGEPCPRMPWAEEVTYHAPLKFFRISKVRAAISRRSFLRSIAREETK